MGRPPRRLGGLRALVKSLGQATHQLAQASSGLANPEAFPTSVAGHCCHLRWENGGVRLLPSLLLDKNLKVFFLHSQLGIPAELEGALTRWQGSLSTQSAEVVPEADRTPSGRGEGSVHYFERAIQKNFQRHCRWVGDLWGILPLVAGAERADGHSCSRHQRGRNHLGGHRGCTVWRDHGCCGLESTSDLRTLLPERPPCYEGTV